MKLWTQMFTVSRCLKKLIVDFDHLNTGQAHAPFTWDAIQSAKQIPKAFRPGTGGEIVGVDTVVAHVHATDHDLLPAAAGDFESRDARQE